MKFFFFVFLVVFSFPAYSDNRTPVDFDNVMIRDFARFFTGNIGEPVVVDPSVEGTVSVYSANVDFSNRSEFLDFFESVLSANGFDLLHGNPMRIVSSSSSNGDSSSFGGFPSQFSDGFGDFRSSLDVDSVPNETRLYSLDNVRAQDVEDIISSVVTSASSSESGSFDSASVSVAPGINALLVSAPGSTIEFLDSVISDFDVEYPQVFIKAMFYETLETDGLDIGAAFGRVDASPVAGGFNTARLPGATSSTGGVLGVLDRDVIALAIEAVQRDSSARLLSTPTILTLSGSRGRIAVGQVVPVVTGRATGEAASVDSPFQTIERISVGLGLDVLPVVLSSGSIVLDVSASADSVSDALFASDIITNERNIETTVRLAPGQTLALGGLLSEEEESSSRGVPGLSRLPLLGHLFRSDSSSSESRVLHVLLTAHVIP